METKKYEGAAYQVPAIITSEIINNGSPVTTITAGDSTPFSRSVVIGNRVAVILRWAVAVKHTVIIEWLDDNGSTAIADETLIDNSAAASLSGYGSTELKSDKYHILIANNDTVSGTVNWLKETVHG